MVKLRSVPACVKKNKIINFYNNLSNIYISHSVCKNIKEEYFDLYSRVCKVKIKQYKLIKFIYDYENVLEELTETLVERFIKRPKRYKFFKTLIYYKSLDYWLPKYRELESLDEFLESKEMNEDRLCYVRDEETGMYSLG